MKDGRGRGKDAAVERESSGGRRVSTGSALNLRGRDED